MVDILAQNDDLGSRTSSRTQSVNLDDVLPTAGSMQGQRMTPAESPARLSPPVMQQDGSGDNVNAARTSPVAWAEPEPVAPSSDAQQPHPQAPHESTVTPVDDVPPLPISPECDEPVILVTNVSLDDE